MSLHSILFERCFPYDDTLTRYTVRDGTLRKIFAHIMRTENRTAEGECYQVNRAVNAVYSDADHALVSLKVNGEHVATADELFTVCQQGYHVHNASAYLNVTHEELVTAGRTRVVATSAQEVLEEYLRNHQNIKRKVEGRLIYV